MLKRRIVSYILILPLVFFILDIYSFGAMVMLHLAVFGIATEMLWWGLAKRKRTGIKQNERSRIKRNRWGQGKSEPSGRKRNRWKREQNVWTDRQECDRRCGSYIRAVLPFGLTVIVLLYGYLNTQFIVKTEYSLETEKEIRPEGYTIAFLSDLHIGTTMNVEKLEKVCGKIEEEKPDLLILGGDIVDESSSLTEVQQTFQVFGNMKSELGVFYVYGNHDKGFYDSDCEFTSEQLKQAIVDGGIRILEDETVTLHQELTLSGRRDRTEAAHAGVKRKSAAKLLEDIKNNKEQGDSYHILVDHQPRGMKKNAAASFDLMLSGHTHGGQIWPVGLITTWTKRETVNYGYKHYSVDNMDGMNLIVSSGIAGWRYPVRTGKHCEYVIVHLGKS